MSFRGAISDIMTKIASFTFNPFAENTYLLYDDSGNCIIIDPGCYQAFEKQILVEFIEKHQLKPKRLLNTHCHIDHMLGNKFIAERYGLELECHILEEKLLGYASAYGSEMGIKVEISPAPQKYIEEDDLITCGEIELKALLAPGHSPGSLCFYSQKDGFLIGGDVLFYGSVGRSDLPGGDWPTLEKSIKTKLMTLPDETVVYPGHEQSTTIGFERKYNPFIQ